MAISALTFKSQLKFVQISIDGSTFDNIKKVRLMRKVTS